MIIPFDRHLKRRKQQEQYRQELVDRILSHHRSSPDAEVDKDGYLEHVKEGFPIEILENIVQKLEQRAGGQ
ncbi:MAG: hypothetical protein EOP07_06765 [Proteobacteria bacterium]|nr:MAG: hypothetical protein EOP07_06765 [Pseudomonadota bacterium]